MAREALSSAVPATLTARQVYFPPVVSVAISMTSSVLWIITLPWKTHSISGSGKPMAVHVKRTSVPMATAMLCGGTVIVGRAVEGGREGGKENERVGKSHTWFFYPPPTRTDW